MTRPRLLVLDEPTEGIQPSIIKDIGRVIRMLAGRGDMAILLIEQYFEFACEVAGFITATGGLDVSSATFEGDGERALSR